MKLFFALSILACTSAFGQVATSVVAFNLAVGMRIYPTVEQAETAMRFESDARCATPGAPADCDLLKRVTHFGIVAFIKTTDPDTRVFEVTARYFDAEGKERQSVEYVQRFGDTAMSFLWIGKVTGLRISALPLRQSGPPLTN